MTEWAGGSRSASSDGHDAARIAELHVEGWREFRSFVPREVMDARTLGPHGRVGRVPAATAAAPGRPSRSSTEPWSASLRPGFCAEPDHGARGEIKNLFVDGAARGTGVGQRLLADAARWLAANGGEPIALYSFTENPYRSAYDRLGGTVFGERPTDWGGIVVPETGYIWASAAELIRACGEG